MRYRHAKTGEVAFLVAYHNNGGDLTTKPRMVMLGDRGRFFVEGAEISMWEKM